jgi:hypothetical protein
MNKNKRGPGSETERKRKLLYFLSSGPNLEKFLKIRGELSSTISPISTCHSFLMS